jgi:hypothetical protein
MSAGVQAWAATARCNCAEEYDWIFDFSETRTRITVRVIIHPTGSLDSWSFSLDQPDRYDNFVAYSGASNQPLKVNVDKKSQLKVKVLFGGNMKDGYSFELRFSDLQPHASDGVLEDSWSWRRTTKVLHTFHLWLPEGYSIYSLNVKDYSKDTREWRSYVTFSEWGYASQEFHWRLTARLVTFQVTIDSENRVPGQGAGSISVDGLTYSFWQLPKVFLWRNCSLHMISVEELIPAGPGTRFVLIGWDDGVTQAQRQIRVNGPLTLAARYKTQYQLSVTSSYGNPTGSGWYDAGTIASVGIDDSYMLVYIAKGWTGSTSSSNPTEHILMDGPKTIGAVWVIDYLRLLMLVGAVATAFGIPTILVLRRNMGRPGQPARSGVKPELPAVGNERSGDLGLVEGKSGDLRIQPSDAARYTRLLAKLEELRAHGQIQEGSYLRLKDEYRKKIGEQRKESN